MLPSYTYIQCTCKFYVSFIVKCLLCAVQNDKATGVVQKLQGDRRSTKMTSEHLHAQREFNNPRICFCAAKRKKINPAKLQHLQYHARTSLVSPLHTDVVSRHARATLMKIVMIEI